MSTTNGRGTRGRAVAALAAARAGALEEGTRIEVIRRVQNFTTRELVAVAAGRVAVKRAAALELLRRGFDAYGRRLAKGQRRARLLAMARAPHPARCTCATCAGSRRAWVG